MKDSTKALYSDAERSSAYSDTDPAVGPPVTDASKRGFFQMDLPQAKARIKQAWIVALICGVLTAIASVLAVSGVEGLELFKYSMVDALIIFALAYGIYRKSRVAASVLAGYWLLNLISLGLSSAVVVRLMFLAIFILGARATFVYHKLQPLVPLPESSIRDQILN